MFDEMTGSEDAVRPAYAELSRWLSEVPPDVLDFRRREAEHFSAASALPSPSMATPRRRSALSRSTSSRASSRPPNGRLLQQGLEQRVKAINAYIKDVYGRREILKAGIVPEDLVFKIRCSARR